MKKGFTLVELLVTVGLFAIIITIAAGGFANAIRTQRQVASLIASQSNVSLALEQMSRQIRTGYLFCNTYGNEDVTNGAGGVNAAAANAGCDCVLSGQDMDWWTCQNLTFYDAEGDHVEYKLLTNGSASGTLAVDPDIDSSTSTFQSITSNVVLVRSLQFQLFGQVEGDHYPPRIMISLGIAPNSTDPAVENNISYLQTTISARSIDCTPPDVNGNVSC